MEQYLRDGRAPIPQNESTSRIMRANKAKHTKPELLLRKALWKVGIRGYKLHLKGIPGKPDIAFTKRRLAIFVNGCFWHRCPYCKLKLPNTNSDFWAEKFVRNIERDKFKKQQLLEGGWSELTIWECQIKDSLQEQVVRIAKACDLTIQII